MPKEDEVIESINFKWLNDAIVDNIYTFKTFEFPLKENNEKSQPLLLNVKKQQDNTFDIFLNDRFIINRKCFNTFTYTNLGCSEKSDCKGKAKYEYVVDKDDKYLIYRCDGENNILETHSCYPNDNDKYSLNVACGDLNTCYGKPNEFIQPQNINTKNINSYSYSICSGNMLVEKECNKFNEYFDTVKLQCIQAPDQCKDLKPNESIVLLKNGLICFKNISGVLNVQSINIQQKTEDKCVLLGNCDPLISHSTAVFVPDLWTSSQFYKECSQNSWVIRFCNEASTSDELYNPERLFENKVDETSLLFREPDVSHLKIFDEKTQKCIPFVLKKHFKNGKVPLIYRELLMESESKYLPLYEFDLEQNKRVKYAEPFLYRINNEYNAYEPFETSVELSNNKIFDNKDNGICKTQYNAYLSKTGLLEFLGVLTHVYSNVILSCRYGNPVNKMVVNKDDKPHFWGRSKKTKDSYTDSSGSIFNCDKNKKQTLHLFITTCVEHRCTRNDYVYPTNYFKEYSSLGVNYDSMYSFCSRTGVNKEVFGPVKDSKLLRALGDYCKEKPFTGAHPYFNIPISCTKKKDKLEVNIINTSPFRKNNFIHTFTQDDDSIFITDQNALHLYFVEGTQGKKK